MAGHDDRDERPRYRTRGRMDAKRDHGPWRGMREGRGDGRDPRREPDDRAGEVRGGYRRPDDAMGPGPYRGRGPKGWTRASERIRDDVCERLTEDDRLDPSDIDIEVREGEVTLTGTVSDRGAKRRAEWLAERVAGVRDVHNQLTIRREGAEPRQQGRGDQAEEV